DYDSEYRYRGRPLAALQGLDRTDRVIYVGSFSKVLFPTLRLGYLVVPPAQVEPFLRARGVLDDHASLLAQPALAAFIEEGHFAAHLRRMRRLYAERQAALLAAGERWLGGLLALQADEAGMHLIAALESGLAACMDDAEASRRAAKARVTALPLSAFYAGVPDRQGLLLGYAGFTPAMLEAGARRLAGALGG
ncbi:MAG TPA: PLP-dependent aminotransferase family protein, partial [Alphaproteobacteria bacterium]|nr:PLP-dependent aminotransferase family protein [Alphaproteobacteria bacterium]